MLAPILLFTILLSPPQQKAEPMAAAVTLASVPDQAVRENQRLATKLSPSASSKVQSAAGAVRAAIKQQPQMTLAQVQGKAHAAVIATFPGLSAMDVDSVVFLVMMQAAQEQETDMQQAISAMQKEAAAKQSARSAQNSSTTQTSDMSSTMQMRLQLEMDQRSKLLQAISNMMKSASDTQTSIITNLK